MLKLKRNTKQQYCNIALTFILPNINNFLSIKVVDRVSEIQLQVCENSNLLIWRLLA